MRPAVSYRAQRRNNRSHLMRAKKVFLKEVVELWRGKWNIFPIIENTRERKQNPWFAQFFTGFRPQRVKP